MPVLDYSFVTGESEAVSKQSGDKLFAGGKQLDGSIEIDVLKSVEQSYLTQLWSNDVFSKNKEDGFTTLTNAYQQTVYHGCFEYCQYCDNILVVC